MIIKRWIALTLVSVLLLLPLNLAAASSQPLAPTAATWYVDHAAAGANSGGSWTDAFTRLQSALEAAQPGDQVWVAQGVYIPTNAIDSTATFTLTAGVALYGGFNPAGGAGAWEERDWETHVTVLSGDLDGNDLTDPNGVLTSTTGILGNNVYHVLTSSGLTETTRLDGFYVTGGCASDAPNYNDRGGGMYNIDGNPSLINVTFAANHAHFDGGGIYNDSGSPNLINVTFTANLAEAHGGGVYNNSGSPSLVDVIFNTNRANTSGGGMFNDYSSPNLINAIFSANQAGDYGGGMVNHGGNISLINTTFTANQAFFYGGGIFNAYGTPLQIYNSILWGNNASEGSQIFNQSQEAITIRYSDVQGGCPVGSTCESLIDADPLFVRPPSPGSDATWGTADDDYGDLRLGPGSPAIDAGSNALLPADTLDLDSDGNTSEPLPLDLDNSPRIVGPTVDMGAYEARYTNLALHKFASTAALLPGQALTYTLAFRNTGVFTATQVWISDTLPGELQILGYQVSSGVQITTTGSFSYTWMLGDLAPGESGIIMVSAVLTNGLSSGYVFTNTAEIGSAAFEHELDDNRSYVTVSVGSLIFLPQVFTPHITWHVDHAATGANTGRSWTDAFTRLQFALTSATAGDQIWVAQGVYTPTNTSTRTATFNLKAGVALYGGFAPASGADAWEERDWHANVTVLSGDLDGNDITDPNGVVTSTANMTGTNAYHVLTSSGLTETAQLDGFYITGGNANEDSPNGEGGGMYNTASSPNLANVTFIANYAGDGGGMYNTASSPSLTHVTFSSNQAYSGGGMLNMSDSNPNLTQVTFTNNQATWGGGGMCNSSSNPDLKNVTFTVNRASDGGGIYNQHDSNLTLVNVAFTANQATGWGGGMYNSFSSPDLKNATFFDNHAEFGGGMLNMDSNPSLINVTFTANQSERSGGGMFNTTDSNPSLINVTFTANQADYEGGGMYNQYNSNPTLVNVTFTNNRATQEGGGMMNKVQSNPILVNVTFTANQASKGGGISNQNSSPNLFNVTLVTNQATTGGGIYNRGNSNVMISNSLLWGNSALHGVQLYNDTGSTATIHYSDLQGGCPDSATCSHLINTNPLFKRTPSPGPDAVWGTADDDYGNLRLKSGSPAINAGANALLPLDTLDLDGDGNTSERLPLDLDMLLRIFGAAVDMGAYEAH